MFSEKVIMNSPVSAFEVYKKQNKRKHHSENQLEHKATLPTKKAKKSDNKNIKTSNLNGFSSLTNKDRNKNNQKKKKRARIDPAMKVNGDTPHSDDEIPTLVPIVSDSVKEEKAEKLKKSAKTKNIDSNGIIEKKSSSKKSKSSQEKSKCNNEDSLASDTDSKIIVNPVTQGLAVFKWILDPITPKEFFENYWEKEVLYVKHSDESYFGDIFSSDKLDSILREYPLYFTRNVDVVAYENGKKEVLNPEGRAVPSQLWDYYQNGCSVRVLNPHTYDQNVHSLISSLQEYFGTMVGTNVYLTPPGSQGFAPHFDDIEAFIVQLEGTKHWKLYKPKGAVVLARDSSLNFKPEEIGEPFMEVTLNAGDLLYFPRGTIHEGRTQNDAHSLHITVSVYQHTAYVDLLEQLLPMALKKAANENIEYRKGLPLNYLKHVGVVNQNEKSKQRQFIINKVKSLVERLVDYMDVDTAADMLGRKFMHDAMPPLYTQEEAQHSSKYDGDCMMRGKVYNRVEINAEVRVRLLRYYAVRIVKENENTSKLYYCTDNAKTYHGEDEQWLEIDNSLIPAFELLHKKYPEFVEVGSLPIEEESAKLQLVSDLWERGLLVTDGPLPNTLFDSDSETDEGSEEYEIESD